MALWKARGIWGEVEAPCVFLVATGIAAAALLNQPPTPQRLDQRRMATTTTTSLFTDENYLRSTSQPLI